MAVSLRNISEYIVNLTNVSYEVNTKIARKREFAGKLLEQPACIAMRRLDLPAMGQVLFNAYWKRDDESAAFLGFGFHAHRAVVMFSDDEI